MDRPSRAALAALNAQLERWGLPTQKRFPAAPAGHNPFGYVIFRALTALKRIDPRCPPDRVAFECGLAEYRYWGPDGLYHVVHLTEATTEFIVRFGLGEYPALRLGDPAGTGAVDAPRR